MVILNAGEGRKLYSVNIVGDRGRHEGDGFGVWEK